MEAMNNFDMDAGTTQTHSKLRTSFQRSFLFLVCSFVIPNEKTPKLNLALKEVEKKKLPVYPSALCPHTKFLIHRLNWRRERVNLAPLDENN